MIRDAFTALADIQDTLARDTTLGKRGEEAMHCLHHTHRSNGTIFVLADPHSRTRALHLAEELQVRFRAGVHRPDREAISCHHLTDHPLENLPEVLQAYCRPDQDCLVVFASSTPQPELARALRRARDLKLPTVVVAGTQNDQLLSYGNCSFAIPSSDRATISVIHTVILHALCETFEPEFEWGKAKTFPDLLQRSAALLRIMSHSSDLCDGVATIRAEMHARLEAGASLTLCGNGGSACDALELYAAAMQFRRPDGLPYRVHHLLDSGFLTCAYNDGFSPFARGVEGIRGPKDFMILISTSGRSQNLIEAARRARERHIHTVALLGKNGGELRHEVTESLIVPHADTERIQEVHLALGYLLLTPVQ
jgi:D-sedoheptulose 7-phosphate isomerase